MKINIEMTDEELNSFNQDTLENHIIANADKIAKSIYSTQLKKARGGEIKLIDELSEKLADLYDRRLQALSKTILEKTKVEKDDHV
jgi:5'-deoxynucleotidase YfbR-like HD superfamily hydrolase